MALKFTLAIDCGNDSFANGAMTEIAKILEGQAYKLRYNDDHLSNPCWDDVLRDTNGNRVGTAIIFHDEAAVNG